MKRLLLFVLFFISLSFAQRVNPSQLRAPTGTASVTQFLICVPSGTCAWAQAGVVPNPQTGTTYTVLATDRLKYLSFSNGSAIAVTLPQAGTSGFSSNFTFVACNIGAGTATITPTTSTISSSNGTSYTAAAASLALTTAQCAWVYSDNTNYFAIVRSGGNAGTVTSVGLTVNSTSPSGIFTVTGSPVTTSGTLNFNLAGTSGGIPYFSSGTVLSSSAALAAAAVVLGGGAGTTPATSSLTYSQPTLTVSSAGNGSAILQLSGNTSGTANFTAPAIAGTSTNGVTVSNVLQGPAGAQLTPTYAFSGATSTGMYSRSSVLMFSVANNDTFAVTAGGGTRMLSSGAYAWSQNSDAASSADTSFNRPSAGLVSVNSTSLSDALGNLQFAKVTKYNSVTTISAGVPAEYATVDLTAQSAAIAATTLYAVPAAGLGMYRISWSATITTAGSTSSVLGGTAGFQIVYTSPTDSVVKTTVTGNSVTSAANTTGTAVGGVEIVYAKASTNIQYQYDYTSVGGTAMVYELHIKCEAL